MKSSYKKYNLGGVAQSFGSPMLESGMQSVTANWAGSPVSVFSKGGYMKRVPKDEMYRVRQRQMHERLLTEGVGNFELPKDRHTRYLYALDDFDQGLVKDFKLKPNEHIFRWESEATKVSKITPLVKINLDNQMAYLLTDKSMDDGIIEFRTKGIKTQVINISDKYAQGGKIKSDSLQNARKAAKQISKDRQGKFYVLETLNTNHSNGENYREYTWGEKEDVDHIKGISHKISGTNSIKIIGCYANGELVSAEEELIYKNDVKQGKMAKGGQAEVKISSKDSKLGKESYKGVLDDFDLDGLPNADDPHPLEKNDKHPIEQMKLSTTLNNVIRVKEEMDVELDEFIGKIQKAAPNDSKIFGRTKTPYSILNKLVNSRLLDEKRGLKDLVGTTVAFHNYSDLLKFKSRVEKGVFGKVLDYDDYYKTPNDGYRAYHFVIEQNSVPIELQLKTDRMKQINVLSHDAYKNKVLDKDYLLYLTTIANDADNGNKSSISEYDSIMKDRVNVRKKLSGGK